MTMAPSSVRFQRFPPAILIGGAGGNSLSVARSLGREGIPVFLLPDSTNLHSRYARQIELSSGPSGSAGWLRFLLGSQSKQLRGAVLLSCCDAGIELLLEHRDELAQKYQLDIADRVAQRRLLNKLSTYEAANEAGVPAPRFWTAENEEQVMKRRVDYVFPLLVKPLYSHRFQAVFGTKFFRVSSYRELMTALRVVWEHDLEAVLLEEIPGPDDRLCSYYTYFDEAGMPVFDFTKRIIRRYPKNRGLACYHVTDWNPEVRDLGRKLFHHVGLLGLGNVEFKRDTRDGQLKVIECNARFTAANSLLVESGLDLGTFIYHRLIGDPRLPLEGANYQRGLHLWSPGRDFRAFIELHEKGELSLVSWLASLAHYQVLPYFRWDDPLPALFAMLSFANHATGVAVRRLRWPHGPSKETPR